MWSYPAHLLWVYPPFYRNHHHQGFALLFPSKTSLDVHWFSAGLQMSQDFPQLAASIPWSVIHQALLAQINLNRFLPVGGLSFLMISHILPCQDHRQIPIARLQSTNAEDLKQILIQPLVQSLVIPTQRKFESTHRKAIYSCLWGGQSNLNNPNYVFVKGLFIPVPQRWRAH